jgi:putative ABC transport system substrate-binding protein
MKRRTFISGITFGLLAAPLAAEAQQAAKVARLGFLALNPAANPHLHEAFRQGLRDLGYVEGRNLVIEYRSAEGKPERLPALAAELDRRRRTHRPGCQASDQDSPHCLRCCW